MIKAMYLLCSLFLLIAFCNSGLAKEWRGITPLKSTRADVQRLFGLGSGDCKCQYQTDTEYVSIEYAKAPCKGYPSGWNVSADTVLKISVTPKKEQQFSELNLDLSKYERAFEDTPRYYYGSHDEGIQYIVLNGLIETIKYVPSTKDSKLRCPCFPLEDFESIWRTSPLDELTGLTLNAFKARLDVFAFELRDEAERKGYVIFYRGKKTSESEFKRFTQSLKANLKKSWVKEFDKITFIDGGYKHNLSVETYIFPEGWAAPKPRQTYAPCKKEARK